MTIEISWLEGLVPILVPIAARLIIQYVDRLPKWMVPTVVVPILGVAGQALAAYVEGAALDPILGLTLAGLGLALREASDQAGKAYKAHAQGRRPPRFEGAS